MYLLATSSSSPSSATDPPEPAGLDLLMSHSLHDGVEMETKMKRDEVEHMGMKRA